jgi:anaerobic selenocysteine-containing dehydrogenase
VLHALNGAFRESRGNRKRHPVNHAWMNPDDMAELGLCDGDAITIASAHGAITGYVRGEDRLRRGVVSMTHMFGTLEGTEYPRGEGGSNVGRLTSLTEHLQPINFMPRFSAVPITVTRM